MSVSLLEVIEAAGYDLDSIQDCVWLLAKRREFTKLVEQAQNVLDNADQAVEY